MPLMLRFNFIIESEGLSSLGKIYEQRLNHNKLIEVIYYERT